MSQIDNNQWTIGIDKEKQKAGKVFAIHIGALLIGRNHRGL
jgi:hypothetical protein